MLWAVHKLTLGQEQQQEQKNQLWPPAPGAAHSLLQSLLSRFSNSPRPDLSLVALC